MHFRSSSSSRDRRRHRLGRRHHRWTNFGQPGDVPPARSTSRLPTSPASMTTARTGRQRRRQLAELEWLGRPDADDYISFGFTVDAGYSVDLDTFWFGSRRPTRARVTWAFYSVDGFTTPIYTFTQSGTNFNNAIADVSPLTGLTGTVEFRIAALSDTRADGGTGISGSGTFRVGDHFDGSNFTEVRFEGIPHRPRPRWAGGSSPSVVAANSASTFSLKSRAGPVSRRGPLLWN